MNAAVFASSADNDQDPYACNLNGLSKLEYCPYDDKSLLLLPDGDSVIRGATMAGVFVPAPWATGGQALRTLQQARDFYGPSDFDDMRSAGLNTVVLPIPAGSDWWDVESHTNQLRDYLDLIHNAKLHAILQLVADRHAKTSSSSSSSTTTSRMQDLEITVSRATALGRDDRTVLAVQLPTLPSSGIVANYTGLVAVARLVSTTVPLLIPVPNNGQLAQLTATSALADDPHLYAAMSFEHSSTIADVASSNSLDDRMKMFYHESIACTQRSPIEYAACYKNMPVFVSSGFDLAIDNCAMQQVKDDDNSFVDYGQCTRWTETVDSAWWERHRQSLATRQIAAYERGLGWTFAAWKVWEDDNTPATSTTGKKTSFIEHPAQLLSFKAVTAAGLMPDNFKDHGGRVYTAAACLNPPLTDFVLGDATLAPVPAPPPDCGNGWWNASIQDCTYWIPPPPPPPCPVCDATTACHNSNNNNNTNTTSAVAKMRSIGGHHDGPINKQQVGLAFGAGALITLLLGWVLTRIFGRNNQGYSTIPN